MTRIRRAIATLTLLTACTRSPEPQPSPPALTRDAVVVDVDGLAVRHGEVIDACHHLEALDPALGHRAKTRAALDTLLRQKLHERAFHDQRKRLEEQARGVARSLGDSASIDQLETIGRQTRSAADVRGLSRRDLSLRIQHWAFDELNVGRVSPLFADERGFLILATRQKHGAITPLRETIDAYLLPFYVHERRADHERWMAEAVAVVASKLRSVHPDYRDSLPTWIRR